MIGFAADNFDLKTNEELIIRNKFIWFFFLIIKPKPTTAIL